VYEEKTAGNAGFASNPIGWGRLRRYVLSEKERKVLEERLKELYGLAKVERAEVAKSKKNVFYIVDGTLAFMGEELIPTLCGLNRLKLTLPKVLVDDGAVRALAKGADLFVPGIKGKEGDAEVGKVVIAVTLKGVPVAVLKVLMKLEPGVERGKFGQNLHYLGDQIWEACSKGKLPEEE
jgi:PUA domain protein